MAIGEILASQHKVIRDFTLNDLEDVSNDEALWKPPAGLNPIIWLAGHICIAEDGLILGLCKGRPTVSKDFRRVFDRGSEIAGDMTAYPSLSEIIDMMKNVHKQVLGYISGVTPEDMEEPVTRDIGVPFLKKRGDALIHVQRHEAYHHAQIRHVRKLYADET